MSRASRKQARKLRAAKTWLERTEVAGRAWGPTPLEDPAYDALGRAWLVAETCYVQALINYCGF